ncbi:glucose-6-phosphate dehydrogenase [Cohnella cellulosilytica]|uniref:Glucose-6-phosphate 1-dehydrogenase n=1 Tax=Cohnella cellulosilytica TaxID=986710 RepID=A0ABW2FFU0_9BACL
MESATFVLFGATGDLAKRKIYPALYNLFVDGKLPESFSLFGLGRREWTDESFQANVEQSVRQFSRREAKNDGSLERFVRAFRYNVLDIGRKEDYARLLERIEQREDALGAPPNRLFYLSVGPEFFETIAANILESGLGSEQGWKRLVIEKPFGHDLPSARELNRKLSQTFAEEEIFRIDHYLGKPMVQKMGALQQANPVIQALWTNRYIANVQITASETVGVEERAGYYDHVGALRDMFQNHMLQLLMMAAIHLPHESSSEQVRFKKQRIMQAVVPLQKQDVAGSVVRGQYAAGAIGGKPVAGYSAEPGIAEDSTNDTFIAARLEIDDIYWRGVPFYIRTGKRMKEKSTRIVVEFKEPLQQPTQGLGTPNLLVFEIGPKEGIRLHLNTKEDGEFKPMRVELHGSQDDVPEAYENLIHDALRGDGTFFAHWDEVELSWQWVQPILDAFAENLVPLHAYAAGSYGPAESDELLARDGYRWWFDEEITTSTGKGEQYAYNANY